MNFVHFPSVRPNCSNERAEKASVMVKDRVSEWKNPFLQARKLIFEQ
jgi:hypothetical protein